MIHHLRREAWIPQPVEAVFDFFSRAENLERITPAWLRFRMLTASPVEMRAGTLLDYQLRIHGFPVRWRTRIESWDPPRSFVDVQERGPYRLWRHTHTFVAERGGTTVRDHVEYGLPLGLLGDIVNRLVVARDVQSIFDYRAGRMEKLLP